MKKNLIIYHSADLDGLFSGAVVKMHLDSKNENYDHIGYNYNEPIPNYKGYKKVFMVDVSFDEKSMVDLKAIYGNDFIWIDHHDRTIKKMEGTGVKMPHGVISLRKEKNYCAAELAYLYLMGEEIPFLLEKVGDYDTFRFKDFDDMESTLDYQYGLDHLVKNITDAEGVLRGDYIHGYIKNLGKTLKESDKKRIKNLITELGFSVFLDGKRFLSLNAPFINPHKFNDIRDEIESYYDGFISYYYDGDKYKYSLRSNKVDVSLIASKFNGGGHRGAAGFSTKELIF
jgi:oligoribonuclease NrnB/cAMP/cGMP phosphodiesterase (DHH superfamily)